MDLHILPLCAFLYLLNYLDRGNIGNSKVLNNETGDSLLQRTNMTNTNYAVAVSLFSLAYALFEGTDLPKLTRLRTVTDSDALDNSSQ